jgi:predicted deacetylase
VKVAIRDDDTCYFTTPEELQRVYGGIWESVPVCLATIPFAKGYKSPAVPQAYWDSGEAYALERNEGMSAFLRELVGAGRATIALHGFTHEDFAGGWEFQAAPDPHRRVREGHAYLQDLLHTPITIFVPPHNALSKAGFDAVRRQRLNLLGSFLSFHPARRPFEWHTVPNWWRIQRFRARTGRRRRDPMVYPLPLQYRNHAEFGCHSLIPRTTLPDLIHGFEEARAHQGDLCLATHYWEVDDRLRGILTDFLDYASRYSDVRFVKAEALFDRG